MMATQPREARLLRWHPGIPAAPVVAVLDLEVNGEVIEGARLVEDTERQWWGQSLRYGGRDYFLAPPARGKRDTLRPARWAAHAAEAVLPRMGSYETTALP